MTNNIYVSSDTTQNKIDIKENAVENFNQDSKDWASKMDGKVKGIDYSAKYYALQANNAAEEAENSKNSILNDSGFIAISTDLNGINTIGACAANLTQIQNASSNAQSAANSAQTASEQASMALQHATTASNTLANCANVNFSNITENATELIKQIVNFQATQQLISLPHIIEFYQNNSSWYRIYSDGWIEQGGCISKVIGSTPIDFNVTFLKAFSNTNYYRDITILGGQSTATSGGIELGQTNFMAGFLLNTKESVNTNIYWIAAGYKA